MRTLGCLLIFILTAGVSSAQRYKTFDSDYFEIGDSIRAEIDLVGGTAYKGWNVKGADKDRIIRFLEKNPQLSVGINVYTDTRGSKEANLETSKEVAKSMIEWLADEGFSKDRFTAKGWGESHPVVAEEVFSQYRGPDRAKWDSIHALNKRVILVINDVEQKMNCAYRASDVPELQEYYQLEKPGAINLGDKFRLDFVKFEEGKTTIANFDADRDKYEALAAFILCYPGVIFQISMHDRVVLNEFRVDNTLSLNRSKELVNKMIKEFNIPKTRILPKGFGDASPIIPRIILKELENEPARYEQLAVINERAELQVVGIGAFNDAVRSNQLRIIDSQTTREVLYRNFEHHLSIQAYFDFDSLQPIASNNEGTWKCVKTSPRMWDFTVIVHDDSTDKAHISFLGWSKGKSSFLYTHTYPVLDLGNPDVYLGDVKVSNSDLSVLTDEQLFYSPNIYVKYDTSIYYLKKSFDVNQFRIQVGVRKFVIKSNKLSKRVQKAIKNTRVETNIWFAGVQYDGTGLDIDNGYDKKTRSRKNDLFQEPKPKE